MKGDKSAVFDTKVEDDAEEKAPDSAVEKAEPDASDSLLGNAFDAFQDGDRAGFIRSMRAAIAGKD